MFGIGPTPFDLRLMAFRIPVRVHPSFWVMAALLQWDENHLKAVFIFVICLFVSVLVHELGHAFTAEAFGWPSEIVLYYLGGVAMSERHRNNTPARSLAVSFMGPMAGFMLYALVFSVERVLNRFDILESPYRYLIFYFLKWINLYWGLFNLVPVLPLDGGHIVQSLLQMTRVRDPDSWALKIGAVTAGLAAYYFFDRAKLQFTGMMMLFLCVQNVAALQSRR